MGSINNVFFGFLKAGEVVTPSDSSFDPSVYLAVTDISLDSHSTPAYLAVNIKALKTDPFRWGATIYFGRTYSQICPVVATLRYLVERGHREGPLFIFEDGRLLTHEGFIGAIREALATASVDTAKYSGHSFHIGVATTAAERGVQDSLIKTMGRWESSAYLLYICTPRDTLCSVAKTLIGNRQGTGSYIKPQWPNLTVSQNICSSCN